MNLSYQINNYLKGLEPGLYEAFVNFYDALEYNEDIHDFMLEEISYFEAKGLSEMTPEQVADILNKVARKKYLAFKATKDAEGNKSITPDERKEWSKLKKETQQADKTGVLLPLTLKQMAQMSGINYSPAKKGDDPVKTRTNAENVFKAFKADAKRFSELVTQEPSSIFSQNTKMAKTTQTFGNIFVYETGIPAYKGLRYDEKNKKFEVVSTCPMAGECILWCYARKGYYSMAEKPMKLTQRLNLMINKPDRYKEMAINELKELARKHKTYEGTDNQLVIRWNDAGDFFSAHNHIYEKLANEIIAAIEDTKIGGKKIQMASYAYTKNIAHLMNKSSKIHWTFSGGAKAKGNEDADPHIHKMSQVVPKIVFDDIFNKKKSTEKTEDGERVNIVKSIWNLDKGTQEELKHELFKRIYERFSSYGGDTVENKYNFVLPGQKRPNGASELIMQEDLPRKIDPEEGKYAVVVKPSGDSDIGASRKDVKTIFLLIHGKSLKPEVATADLPKKGDKK